MKNFILQRMIVPLLLLVSVFVCSTLFAQSLAVGGKIINEKSEPVPNVSIQVKGTSIGTTTDENGNFLIKVPNAASVLVFSSIGYDNQEIKIGKQSTINIVMKTGEAGKLNEVIVVGYGTQKKATLTGAVVSVKGSEVNKSPAANVSNNLVGRLPGLSAVQSSGEPGYDGSNIRIRGSNTLNDNSVLVVVDGIPGRSLERVDPNSIESVTVLKDASAAIYGSRAANGVILITTKRGKSGKPQLSLSAMAGFNQPTTLPKMADAATYAQMNNEIIVYANLPATQWLPAYQAFKTDGSYTKPDGSVLSASSTPIDGSPEGIELYRNGKDPWGHPNTDWFGAVLRKTSPQSSYNMTLSGGSDNMRYFVSIGKIGQDGNYYHSATRYDQYNFRTNIDGKITKDISLAFDVAGRLEDRQFPTRSSGDIFRMILRGKPTLPAYWPDGTPGPDIEYGNNPAVISTDATGYNRDKNYVMNSNFKLNINIPWVKGLSLSGNLAIDKSFRFGKVWQTPWYLYTWDYKTYDDVNGEQKPHLERGKRGFDAPQLSQNSLDGFILTANGLLNYDRVFGGVHSIKFLVGVEKIKGDTSLFSAFRTHYVSGSIDQLFAGASLDKDNNGSGSVNSRLSTFGRINYAYKEKYLAEFVWRYDGSYIFNADRKQYGFFPGISAGWRASEENFWKQNISFISDFKLRGSWGQTGNDRIPEWQYLGTYGFGNFVGLPYYPFVTNGSTENTTIYETRVPNPDVTWERANQADVGFDAAFLKSKLSVTADYFNYRRTQLLLKPNASLPGTTGYIPPFKNIGKVSNQGFEASVSYSDRVGKKFSYRLSVNSSYSKNKILFFDEAPGAPDYQKSTGHPMNGGIYYIATGVFVDQAQVDKTPHYDGALPGDIIFEDVDGNGKIDANDRKRINKTNFPTYIGGFTADLQYGSFDLSVLLQAATGGVNYVSTESGLIGDFLESFADGRWTPENPSSTHPRTFDRGTPYWASQGNTYFLHKTDYLRLKTVQFGYTVPSKLMAKAGITTARIYFAGYNLLTYSPDYKDFDPELASSSGQSYPLQRIVSFGVNVTF